MKTPITDKIVALRAKLDKDQLREKGHELVISESLKKRLDFEFGNCFEGRVVGLKIVVVPDTLEIKTVDGEVIR